MRSRALLSSFVFFLMSCVGLPADSQSFPSLARRPVESRDFEAEQRAAAQQAAEQQARAPVEAALQGQIAKLDAEAKAGAMAFDAAYPVADRQVSGAVGAGPGDDGYAAAQSAISGLEVSRNQSVMALAGLDSLYAERLATGGAEAVAAARARALTLVDNQNDRLDSLKVRLRRP